MVNGNYLTLNNATVSFNIKGLLQKTAALLFGGGGGKNVKRKTQKPHNTKKHKKHKKTKKNTKKSPPPPWNLCMESLHIFFFIHLDPGVFCPSGGPVGNSVGSATQAWAET